MWKQGNDGTEEEEDPQKQHSGIHEHRYYSRSTVKSSDLELSIVVRPNAIITYLHLVAPHVEVANWNF